MQNEDMRTSEPTPEEIEIARKVHERTSVYAGLCFETTEDVRKAQQFICVLIKRGVLRFNEA